MKLLLAILLCVQAALATQPNDSSRPNIILILVDDMGYSDIGCYGGEVKTPNIDRLARRGLRFTSMYNTSKCFPSRACLLIGVYAQQCGMGRSSKGGIRNAVTVAELLRTQGYRTLAVGKHHSTTSLHDRGFDRFYGFHYGPGKSCANHFNPGLQRPGEGVPARKRGETRTYCFDDEKMIPHYSPSEKDWYTTDYFTNWAVDFLEEYKDESRPYFLYVYYTAPHDPLHAWPEDVAKYDGVYDVGYGKIREARFQRQKEQGLFGREVRLSDATHTAWDALSPEKKRDQIRRMQVYAAMIDRVDQNIGKLLAKVRSLGQEENTLILFASDNGCSSENVNTGTGEIGSLTRWASLQRDWANVSNTPFRYWKNLSHEGGIRTPFIVYWPRVITDGGGINRQPVHFVDVMATFLEITGAAYPDNSRGQSIVPLQGESLLPALAGKELPARKNPIFFEYGSGGAVREKRWKLVTKSLSRKPGRKNQGRPEQWELYDMDIDMTEITNVADQNPDVARRLGRLWTDWRRKAYSP